MVTAIDLHQHLWPEPLVDRLRARTRAPYLRGWTLHTQAEPPYDVDPAHHDVDRRIAADRRQGVGVACVSLSAPLGIENLVRPEAAALLAAWHEGARALPPHFRPWASVPMVDPDLDGLATLLDDGFIGLQVPATDLASPAAWERAGDLLRVA
ncbi:MAG: amidohydrolase, partial [Nocardioidaceae bacterium]|nr:amidohydrolase [Nocardioidaceae bacterium]